MEKKSFHFSVLLDFWVGEEGKKEPELGFILWAHGHISDQRQQHAFCTLFRIIRSTAPLSLCRREHRASTYEAYLQQSLITYSFHHGCLWFWVELQFLKQLLAIWGSLWSLYSLSDVGFVTDVKTRAAFVSLAKMCAVGRRAAVLVSRDAFEIISVDWQLNCFVVIKLRGDLWVQVCAWGRRAESDGWLWTQKLFYPSWAEQELITLGCQRSDGRFWQIPLTREISL